MHDPCHIIYIIILDLNNKLVTNSVIFGIFLIVLVGRNILFLLQVRQRVGEVGKTLDLLQLLNEGGEVLNMMGERFDWGQFRGQLQLDTAAVMGHSFGGAATLETLYSDKRFKYVPIISFLYKFFL